MESVESKRRSEEAEQINYSQQSRSAEKGPETRHAETNEALVARIKAGEPELMGQLWEQCKRLLWALMRREISGKTERLAQAGVTVEDLEQEVYFALHEAVKAYDPADGYLFTSYLKYPVRKAVFNAIGLRTQRTAHEPLAKAISLDQPLSDDDAGSGTRLELLADPASADLFDQIEKDDYTRHLHDDMELAISELTERKRRVIRGIFYDYKTMEQIAVEEGVSVECIRQNKDDSLHTMSRSEWLKAYRADIIQSYSLHSGYQNFKNHGYTSGVERAALKLVELDEREAEKRRIYQETMDRLRALRNREGMGQVSR